VLPARRSGERKKGNQESDGSGINAFFFAKIREKKSLSEVERTIKTLSLVKREKGGKGLGGAA